MTVKELGEFGLIERLIQSYCKDRRGPDNASPFGIRLTVDAGDDTAAWQVGKVTELFTTDTMVEGVHFTQATTPWRDVGWKVMASNVSDIASMGGLPLYALVTLGLPPDTKVAHIDDLYQGMLEIGQRYGVAIIGGDVVRSPVFFVTISLTGVHDGQPMLRSAARVGDVVAVTGYVGSSAGGLELMLHHGQARAEAAQYLAQAHRRPVPCVEEGRVLAAGGVRAAMDISDGLVDDLGKLCQASGVAATIEAARVPVHPFLKETFPRRYLELALGGGEDYQLLFTAPEAVAGAVLPKLPQAAVIGKIVKGEPGRVTVLGPSGQTLPVAHGGWDHFR